MAEPTVWGFTGVAGATNTFPIEGANLYGVDIAGTLAPAQVNLADNIILLLTATKTDAEIVAAMQAFIQRYGAGHAGAGGVPTQATLQVTSTLTETS
jgi:hypothetical protein